MLDVVNELRGKRFTIEDEYKGTEDSPAARSIAEAHGYEFRGVVHGFTENRYAVLLGRNAEVTLDKYRGLLKRLTDEGYASTPVSVDSIYGLEGCDLILGKRYDKGGVSVMERPGMTPRKAVALMGHKDGVSLMGLFLDTSPEHVGTIEELARYFGMEQITEKTKIPTVFEEALKGLDLDI